MERENGARKADDSRGDRGRRVQIQKRVTRRRELPPLDLRSPSGRRTLPY